MLRDRIPDLRDEEGTSMVEVMVGLAMGMIVLAGLAMLLIVVTRGNARIGARAEASDNANVTMTRIMTELHSACVEPTVAPVQEGSKPNLLIFKRGSYGGQSSATAGAITTEIEYLNNGTLVERPTGPGGLQRTMLTNVGLAKNPEKPAETVPVFRYFNYTVNGETPFAMTSNKLGAINAGLTILVKVAFKASPKSEPVADAGAATEIENSATLRLTPPTYREGEKAKPCE
jgi:type II secretory pathway component PulJ